MQRDELPVTNLMLVVDGEKPILPADMKSNHIFRLKIPPKLTLAVCLVCLGGMVLENSPFLCHLYELNNDGGYNSQACCQAQLYAGQRRYRKQPLQYRHK